MIVRDESQVLARCLDSVKDAVDEIIIVDTGSLDNTKEIALRYTQKVYDFPWIEDFSAARNFSFSKGGSDFLMWLDADDIMTNQNLLKLKKLKEELTAQTAAVYMLYNVAFNDAGEPTFSFYRERLVNRLFNPLWQDPVHETIEVIGQKIYSDIEVEHRKIKAPATGRNLKILQAQMQKGKAAPRTRFYYARELMFNEKIEQAIAVFEDYLHSGQGWFENQLTAARDLSFCYERAGDAKMALKSALLGLSYAPPRGELLCRIGELFLKEQRLQEAKYWYERALDCALPQNALGFVEKDYYGYVPALQLCVICDKLKDYKEAQKYNERAGAFKPSSPQYLYNKKYFESLKGK